VSKAGSKVAAGGQKAPASPKQPEKRDPFVSPLKTMAPATIQAKRPPGKAGMLIGQANLLGVARTPSGMQAIVVAENQTFFLKENDKVFNGRVLKIASDSLVFEETVVDPMGQTVKREVVKKLPVEVK
jgi:Tfp pilus assembly protein PilP